MSYKASTQTAPLGKASTEMAQKSKTRGRAENLVDSTSDVNRERSRGVNKEVKKTRDARKTQIHTGLTQKGRQAWQK